MSDNKWKKQDEARAAKARKREELRQRLGKLQLAIVALHANTNYYHDLVERQVIYRGRYQRALDIANHDMTKFLTDLAAAPAKLVANDLAMDKLQREYEVLKPRTEEGLKAEKARNKKVATRAAKERKLAATRKLAAVLQAELEAEGLPAK